MPPTINKSYATVGNRRVSTAVLREFKALTHIWSVGNRARLRRIEKKIHDTQGAKLCLVLIFKFEEQKLFLKDKKTPRRLDTSNRIKAAEDAITGLLGIDDRWVFKIIAEKITAPRDAVDASLFHYE